MKISVIVPIYNTEEYIEKCVKSLQKQTYSDLQIILVNDGSEDCSLQVMRELEQEDDRIVVVDKKHSGLSATKNAGLDVADGEYISFVDSDDWVDPEMYEKMLAQIKENQADAAYCEWTEEYSDGSSDIKGRDGKKMVVLRGNEILEEHFRNKIYMRTSSGLISKDMIENIRFDTNLQPGEEMLFGFLVLCNARCVVYTNNPFYHRFNRIGSISNKIGFQRTDLRRALSTDLMVTYVEQNKPQFLKQAYAYSFTFYMTVLNHMIFYKCEKENKDIYKNVLNRLNELLCLMETPNKLLAPQVYWAYRIYRTCEVFYYMIVRVYYRDIKKELGGKRQK